MIDKYTNGIFISAPKPSELTKLNKIKLIALGTVWFKEFLIIRIEKTNELTSKGNKVYKLIKTREFAYDSLLIIRRYCNFEGFTSYDSNNPFEKFHLSRKPEKEDFKFSYNRNRNIYFSNDYISYEAEIISNYMNLSSRLSGQGMSRSLTKLMFVPSIK